MFGVAAMAVQNALVQIALTNTPTTAAMTTNVTHFMLDLGEVLVGRDDARVSQARARAMHTLPVIVGFAIGCVFGAAFEAAGGLRSLALPTSLALLASQWVWVTGFAPRKRGSPARNVVSQLLTPRPLPWRGFCPRFHRSLYVSLFFSAKVWSTTRSSSMSARWLARWEAWAAGLTPRR